MTVQTFDMSPQQLADTIVITEAAAEHIGRQLQKTQLAGVRLSLKEAGCTGFKYVIKEVKDSEPGDITLTPKSEVHVFVDPAHIAAFKDLQIDYVEDGLNKQLVMNNPNIKDECGCGESFAV